MYIFLTFFCSIDITVKVQSRKYLWRVLSHRRRQLCLELHRFDLRIT